MLLPGFGRSILRQSLSASALAIFLASAATAYYGGSLAVFLRGAAWAGEALGGSAETGGGPAAVKPFAANWQNTAGIADQARRLGLGVVEAEAPDDGAAVATALSDILANSPVSDTFWQQLADARLKSGAPIENVLAAFRMSDVAGSHEGGAMVARGLFGLEHWTNLPEADRRIVVRDVLATIGQEFKPQKQYRRILAAKSDAERDDVLAALTASGLATPKLMQELRGSNGQD